MSAFFNKIEWRTHISRSGIMLPPALGQQFKDSDERLRVFSILRFFNGNSTLEMYWFCNVDLSTVRLCVPPATTAAGGGGAQFVAAEYELDDDSKLPS